MQFKVPQDVQQADRIVWFLTLPQLIICVVGGAISYAIYAALSNQGASTIFWLPPVILTILTTVAFAFIKIAN
ncbi:MAG: PrgI family protein, partial [Candidatus Gracilibacteria bacterium]|nr:PrgI family protein [Candidatus Gracilibacteria bacterium]